MRRNALALTAIVTFTPAAFGQTFHVRVERSSTSPCVGGVEHDQDHPANQPLSLALSTCALRVIITASTSVNIPRITLTNGPTWPVQISLGSTFSQIGADPTPQGDDWAGLNASGLTTSQFYGGIQGDLTDSILVDQLFRFDAEGAVNAAITAGAVGSSGICIVSAGSIGSSGSVTVTNGDIVEVETIGNMAGSIVSTNDSIDLVDVGGNLNGYVHANNGSLGDIIVTGVVNAPNAPGGLAAIRSMDGLNRLVAESVSSQTTIGLVAGGGLGKLGLVKTTSGDFSASSLTAKSLEPPTGGGESGIVIAGNMAGTIRFQTGGGGQTETIKINGSLTGTIDYDDATGLTNQIIINALGVTDGGIWSGDVIVGSTTLSPEPNYTNLPSAIGGGAVGIAGFTFHPAASDPPHDEVVASAPSSVVVDHYGPVVCPTCNGSTFPLKVEHRPAGTSGSWTDQTSSFSFSVSGRAVTITPTSGNAFLDDKEYRFTPQYVSGGSGATRLKCDYDSDSISVVSYEYGFTILPGSFGPPE